ncbi:hypothetical protein PFISCL1PPCAC_19611 [Pristionchus fissidentatus]|uniref:Uncharacterized protein n=1 Tax=Pristionchus fissidentatus TaxID=1538716 RepID=A0AAV5WET4_9BILA|nr:hypothetical protein PFISCL1PPCAC_19611 [Pristionchus fissidentatus]
MSVPAPLKNISPYIKLANEHKERDPVVYYWCLYYAVQTGMKIDRSPESLKFLGNLLETLEVIKKHLMGNEAITNEVVAQAHLEEYGNKIFSFANSKEQRGEVDTKIAQMFHLVGCLLDVLQLFGELDGDLASTKKYAKWKATQIFQSIKSGTPYVPSVQQHEEDEFSPEGGANANPSSMNPFDLPGVPDSFAPPSNQHYAPPPPSEYSYPPAPPTFYQPPPPPSSSSQYPSAPPRPSLNTAPIPSPHSSSSLSSLTPHYPTPEPSTASLPAAAMASYVPGSISMAQLAEVKKHCKYAMSAVDYEDVPTVIKHLHEALAIVQRR